MTEKLFYRNQYKTEWEAESVSAEKKGAVYQVILDKTCFYPEGGGQPGDRGFIGDAEVINTIKDEDGKIFHICTSDPGKGGVECRLNWVHRWDYMQQHSGQHILSAVLKHELDINTVSVHQGNEYTAVETDRDTISDIVIEIINRQANDLILQNMEIHTHAIDSSGLEKYPLRRPTNRTGKIRLVELGEYDRVACGGVHCARTGEVRLIHVYAVEKIRDRCRVLAKIGDRVLDDYRLKTEICLGLVSDLSVPLERIPQRYEKEKQLIQNLNARVSGLEQLLAGVLYAMLKREELTSAKNGKKTGFSFCEFRGQDPEAVKQVAKKLLEEPGQVFFLANNTGGKLMWLLGCSEGSVFGLDEIRDDLFSVLDGNGGGKAPLWQGFGNNQEGFKKACRVIRQHLSGR
ncbi:MAG: alanyl-tRNA editing protein [Spirochaetales bacterium]|nr:alanyl-tRNA editing protein [Spirochaetales bacterium]